ncbi:MAG: galactosyldiacylglycerol synthase [Candidatus Liptonbacteria bacterium]|nr:galactosyldiacylglycerol synthase [Candidatus Liptonbacteria bacterium]
MTSLSRKTKIDLIYFDAGGGHRRAADALSSAIKAEQYPWQLRLVNLGEVLSSSDPLKRLTGSSVSDAYNLFLRRGWTRGAGRFLRALQAGLRLERPIHERILVRFWRQDTPDLVVSLVPNLDWALRSALRKVSPRAPFVVIPTDMSDLPPHFWLEEQDQFVIAGTPRLSEQARAVGVPPDQIYSVSGMIIQPKFYQPIQPSPAMLRRRLGLLPRRTTGLVFFGGYGSQAMLQIHAELVKADLPIQLIYVCGHNAELMEKLTAAPSQFPKTVLGFTTEVPQLMRAANFMIGKPGPGSLSEAFQMGLPVIVKLGQDNLPQERYNVELVRRNKWGIVLQDFRHIGPAVRQMILPATYAEFRRNVKRIRNRAVFEIPGILAEILARSRRAGSAPTAKPKKLDII